MRSPTAARVCGVVGQLIALRFELGIGQLPVFTDHGDGIGRAGGLLGDELMHTLVARILFASVVPFGDVLPPLGFAEPGKRGDGLSRIGDHALEQNPQMLQPAFDGGEVEQVGVEVAVENQSVIGFDHIEKQVEVYEALRTGIDLHFQAGELEASADPFQVELHFDKRKPAGVALDAQLLNQAAVGIILVIVGIEQGAPFLLEHGRNVGSRRWCCEPAGSSRSGRRANRFP